MCGALVIQGVTNRTSVPLFVFFFFKVLMLFLFIATVRAFVSKVFRDMTYSTSGPADQQLLLAQSFTAAIVQSLCPRVPTGGISTKTTCTIPV